MFNNIKLEVTTLGNVCTSSIIFIFPVICYLYLKFWKGKNRKERERERGGEYIEKEFRIHFSCGEL